MATCDELRAAVVISTGSDDEKENAVPTVRRELA
jgi:hypothetical protein